MALEMKTTILLPADMHRDLSRMAKARKTSLGQLVREACASKYGCVPREDRVKAVEEMYKLSAPVGTPEEMERQSVPTPEELMP